MGVRQLIIGHHFCPIKLIKKKKEGFMPFYGKNWIGGVQKKYKGQN